MKYAVIIPFTEVPNIVNFSTGDTYAKGNVDISKGYLLCPEEEVEQIKKNNSKLTVIGYKGKSVDGIANSFITMLGYKHETISTNGWENKDSSKALKTVLDKTNIKSGVHNFSIESSEEKFYTGLNQFDAIIKQLIEKKIDYDVELATNQLLGIGEEYKIQLRLYIDYDVFTLNNGKILNTFIKKIEENGIIIPKYIYDMFVSKKYSYDDICINNDIPSDVKYYIEKYDNYLQQSFSSNNYALDYFERIFVYEILKQVKELNMNNTLYNESDSVKKL